MAAKRAIWILDQGVDTALDLARQLVGGCQNTRRHWPALRNLIETARQVRGTLVR